MSNVVYFELNNNTVGDDYPPCEPFKSWIHCLNFNQNDWCIENHLCVVAGTIKSSINWCITAPYEWVMENCPDILSNKTFQYKAIMYYHDRQGNEVPAIIDKIGSFAAFVRTKNSAGTVLGKYNWEFLEYSENNYGVHWKSDNE